jgi:succinyl-diaminopimelate desuccinylase
LIEPLALAQALIRCPSVTPAEAGALDVLGEALQGAGFVCHRLPFSEAGTPDVDNLFARFGRGKPHFCFAGHSDVVPVGNAANWTTEPFAGEVKAGRLFGRGASDMKSAVAAFAAASDRFIKRRGKDFGGSISLLITGDEEGPSINGTRKVLEWMKAKGELPDACLVGEPTNPTKLGEMIKIGRRGSLNGKLTVHGIQGHTAYPHLADNPIPRLMRMLTAIIDTPLDKGSAHFQPSTIEISTVDVGNPATNVIPAEARAGFNIRFNDYHGSKNVEAWLRSHFDAVGGRYDLEIKVTGEPFLTPPGPLSDLIARSVEAVTGLKPELSTTGGTSDARFIKDYCPVAEFGLIGATMHMADESILVSDVEQLTAIYEKVLDGFFAAGDR